MGERTTSMFGENLAYSVRSDGADDLYLAGKTESLDLQIDSTEQKRSTSYELQEAMNISFLTIKIQLEL